MAGEVIVPITVKDTTVPENEAWRTINDNFLLFSRRLNDIRSWIDAAQYYEIRNTYVFSDQDSLDASYPFEMDFEIVSEMTTIQTVKLSFRIREFRAYSTTVPSGGGMTSDSATHNHSGSTASGSGSHSHNITTNEANLSELYVLGIHDVTGNLRHDAAGMPSYTFSTGDAAGSHTHSLNISADGAHTHACPDHTHSLTFGIYEDSQSPTIHYHVDNGTGYGAASSNYITDQIDLAITSSISGTGYKRIKFDSDVRCRISAWVMCKIDLTA